MGAEYDNRPEALLAAMGTAPAEVNTLESCSTSINFPIFSLLISFAVAMSPASQVIKPKSTPTTFLKLLASAISQAEIFFVSLDRKSTRLNSSHIQKSRMPSSA